MVKSQQHNKEEETEKLIEYINEKELLVDNINIDNYVSQGAEQKTIKNTMRIIKHKK